MKPDLLSEVFEQISGGFIAIDHNELCVYANNEALKLLNFERLNPLDGKPAEMIFSQIPKHPIYVAGKRALETQVQVEEEVYFDLWETWYQLRIYPYDGGIKIYFNEISERKRVETTLKEKSEQLILALRAANVGLWDWNLQTNRVYFSPEWKHQIGYEDHEIANDFHEWESRVHPDDLEEAKEVVEGFLANPYPDYYNEFRFRHKDGSYRWILAQADLIYDDNDNAIRMIGSHIDITNRKKMEADVYQNEQRFSAIFHLSPLATSLIRMRDTQFIDVNRAMETLTGYSRNKLIGHTLSEVEFYLNANVQEVLKDAVDETGNYQSIDIQLRKKSGEIRDVVLSSKVVELNNEKFIITIMNDITQRKHSEELLQKSEEKFHSIYEQSPLAIQMYDQNGKLIDVNQRTLDLYGIDDKAYLLGYDMWSSPHLIGKKRETLKNGEMVFIPADLDFELIKKVNLFPTNKSGVIHLEMYATPFMREREHSGYLVQMVDVSERKVAERDLIKSEKSYRTLFENMNAGFVLFEVVQDDKGIPIDLIIRASNRGFEKTTGLKIEEVINQRLTQVLPGIEDDEADWIGNYGKVALTGEARQFVQQSQLLGYYYSVSAFQPQPNQCAVTFVDITEQKHAEATLELRERRFRTLIEKSSDLLLLIDAESKITYASPAIELLLGYTAKEFTELDRIKLMHPDDLYSFRQDVSWSLNHPGEAVVGEHRVKHKNGSWRTFRRTLRNLLHDPSINAFVSNLSDITEQKQAEVALEFSERRFRTLIEKSLDFIILLDANLKPIYASPSVTEVLGYTSDEIIQQWHESIVHPDDLQHRAKQYKRIIDQPEETIVSEKRVKHKDGSWRILRWLSRNLLDDPSINAIVSNLSDITDRRKAEEDLRISERLFYNAFHVGPVGMTITRIADGKFVDANNFFCQMFEYEREEVIGRTSTELNMWTLEERQRVIKQQLEVGGLQNFELFLQSRSGKDINVLFSSREININDELCHLTSLVDISERKKVEIALRESEEKYRTLVENASDGIFVSDPQGYYVDVNTRGCNLLGYMPDEIIGKHLSELVAPDNLQSQPLRLDELKLGKSVVSERVLKHKSGSFLPVEISAKMLPDGNLLGIVRDISERKKAEEAMQRYNQRLATLREIDKSIIASQSSKAIANSVLSYIRQLISCPSANLVFIDEPNHEIIVYAANNDDVIISDGMRLPYNIDEMFGEMFNEFKLGKVIVIHDLRNLDAQPDSDFGQQLLDAGICTSLNAPLLINGELIGSLNLGAKEPYFFTLEHEEIVQEVANQVAIAIYQSRLNEQIRQMNDELELRVAERTSQLESKNRELETFTYTVSHDLKAPLRGIDGYSRLLLEDYLDELDEQGLTYLRNVRIATDQMNQLIEDLLAYSRLERRALQTTKVNLRQMSESIVNERRIEIAEKSAGITVSIPDIFVSIDSDGFSMTLRNLLDNALKFTKHGDAPIIEIGGYETNDHWVLWVKDNGIGFDMKYHDRILQIFHRLHRVEDYPGTGIGLAIAQKAMERIGGRIWAESEPNAGSTFYLEMPK